MNARTIAVRMLNGLITSLDLRRACLGLLAVLAIAGSAAQAEPERFEIVKVKAVRPALADTVAALEKGDIAAARAAFAAYDSLWNGIEVYVGTRSKEAYDALEHVHQAKIEKALSAPAPDAAALAADAKAMLAKYDETIDLVAKAPPLNPLYDDVARLRIVRAHLREVVRALKAGNVETARKSFAAFDSAWDGIEDMVKAHSADDYVAIEKGMIEIENLLEKPDAAGAAALVSDVMAKYNATLVAVLQEARSK